MKTAIIGCGYVGTALGRTLATDGHDIVATTTTPSRTDELRDQGLTPALLDIADVDRLHDLLADREAVYLTIAPTGRDVDYRDVYLAAAQSLVSAITDTPVRRIIYTGSTRVYGQDDGSWVHESSQTEPRDENGRVLLQTEQTLMGNTTGLGATILRLGGIYGPERDYRRRIRGLAGTTRTDGDLYVNLVHLDDIVQALVALLTLPYHGVLNLVDDSPERRRAMYDRVLEEANLSPIRWTERKGITGHGKRVRNDLIKRTLGITLRHPTH
jgi:nucleoside-diphosphate-sugar epimerase